MEEIGQNRFRYVELVQGETFRRKDWKGQNQLLFFLTGEIEVIYSGSLPKKIEGGNMIFLSSMADCIGTALTPVKLIHLTFEDFVNVCDKNIFQYLTPIASLLKYDFSALEIRKPLDLYLQLLLIYSQDEKLPQKYLYPEKLKELFILFRGFYSNEELAMFFYPLVGKNIDFKQQVSEAYPRAKSIGDFAEICGYSPVVFQRKFKDIFGETVYQWMQRQKAEHIKHRLMTEEVNLKELIEEFNFTSPAHLNKFCQIWFGMSPSELRQTLLLKRNLK